MAEQASQPQQPEQAPKRRKPEQAFPRQKGLLGGMAVAAAAVAALLVPHGAKDAIEARPVPTTISPTPETPSATPTVEVSPEDESNEAMAAEFSKIKEPALASARALLEKIPSDASNRDDRLRISVDSSTVGHYSPNISAEAVPENGQISVDARDGEGGHGNSLTYTFKVNDKGIFEDNQVTRDEFTTALSDPTKVELTEVKIVDADHNAELGVLHSGTGPTERFNATDAAIGEQNTYVFRTGEEVTDFANDSLQPAMTVMTDRFTQ